MKLRIAVLAIFTLLSLIITGCDSTSTNNSDNDTETIGTWSITVQVDSQTAIEFTNEDALTLGPKDITAAEKDKDVFLESQTWRGTLLNDFLDYLGVDEFSVISVEGADGLAKELDPDRLTDNTGFGWMVDGETLDEESGPVELIADQRGPKWWIKNISKIIIIT